MVKVFVAGCFDVIHVGHINLLLFARQLAGDHGTLHVSIDTDEKIIADKGPSRPIHDQASRFAQLRELQFNGKGLVDYIYNHNSNGHLYSNIALATKTKQDRLYIVVGDSYKGKQVIGEELGMVIYYPQSSVSSSYIIEQILLKHKS